MSITGTVWLNIVIIVAILFGVKFLDAQTEKCQSKNSLRWSILHLFLSHSSTHSSILEQILSIYSNLICVHYVRVIFEDIACM